MKSKPKAQGGSEVQSLSSDDCINFLVENLSVLLVIPKDSIDINADFSEFALDSIKLMQLTVAISKYLSIEMEPTLLLEYGSIKASAHQLIILHQAELNKIKTENKKIMKINVVASFTAEPLEESLNYLFNKIAIKPKIEFAPYNQVFQQLIDKTTAIHSKAEAINIILFRVEDFFRFNQDVVEPTIARQTVSEFIALLTDFAQNTSVPTIVVMCPHTPTYVRKINIGAMLEEFDNTIAESLEPYPHVHFLDLRDLASAYKISRVLDEARDKMGHIPFSQEFFTLMGLSIVRRSFTLLTVPHKVIVVDCDNTLWGGVCGEEGAINVDVSGPFAAFQKMLLAQKEQGKIICLCSKNTESDVWAVFEKNKNMVLKRDDIVAHRINWERKSQNMYELANELNLGLDSFIFIDDNPIECADISQNISQVLTIQLPSELDKISSYFSNHWAFDARKITNEDKQRTKLYQDNAKREELKRKVSSLDDFIKTLEVAINIEPLQPSDLARASQLTHRTNQFNATTIRQSESEISLLMNNPEWLVVSVKVSDRFGDYGFVGLMMAQIVENELNCTTFLMSCRVLGRKVEQTMLKYLATYAQQHQLNFVNLFYGITQKNKPLLDFYTSLNIKPAVTAIDSAELYQLAFKPDQIDKITDHSKVEHQLESLDTFETKKIEPDNFHSAMLKNLDEIAHLGDDIIGLQRSFKSLTLSSRPCLSTEYIAPRNDWQKKMSSIWSDVLRIDRVGIYDNFYDLGGSSLSAAEMFAKMWEIGVPDTVSLQNMPEPTIAGLAQIIQDIKEGNNPSFLTDYYSLEDEGQVPEDIVYKGPKITSENLTMNHVFITGATGFIGAFIISELFQQTSCQIICLVRASTDVEAKNRVINNLKNYDLWQEEFFNRIHVICGDLGEDYFGMSAEKFQSLAHSIDCIFHCGAWVNFVYPYETIKKYNVGSVETIMRLAVANTNHPVRLHFVSTFGVIMSPDYRGETVFEHEELRYCEGLLNGYEQSKYVGDKMIWRGIHERGIAANIYRPALVSGPSSGVYKKYNEFLPSFIKGCIQLGSTPIIDPDCYFEMVPVDFITKAIVGIAKLPETSGNTYFSLHPRPVYSSDCAQLMREYGYNLRALPFDIWKKEFLSQPSDILYQNALFPFIDFIRIMNNENAFFTRADRTEFVKAIAPLELECPDITVLLKRYFDYFVTVGYLPAPGQK